MTDSGEPDDPSKDGSDGLERCDVCGTIIFDACKVSALVPDSAAIYAFDDLEFDGQRLVTACSLQHLAALQERYRRRPFIVEELWVGKIARALDEHAGSLTCKRLAEVTGLSQLQIDRAIDWQNERHRGWRHKHHPEQ